MNDADLKALGRAAYGAGGDCAPSTSPPRLSTAPPSISSTPGPARSPEAWARELTEALARAREHLSLYQLTIEPDTMFERLFRAGKLKMPDPDLGARPLGRDAGD